MGRRTEDLATRGVSDGRPHWAGRILRLFCRAPNVPDYAMEGIHYEQGKEITLLAELFPGLFDDLVGKRVVDFGCGLGYQSIALARAGAREVIGVDINDAALAAAEQLAIREGVTGTVRFSRSLENHLEADTIISQNSFEHFLNPEEILARMRDALAPGGRILITFSPPWHSPWGAHMGFFCRLPWIQSLFPERTVMEVRSAFRPDGARTYREAGLGQLSVGKFEAIVKRSRLRCTLLRYDCVCGLNWLRLVPLRELFINRVSCVLGAQPREFVHGS